MPNPWKPSEAVRSSHYDDYCDSCGYPFDPGEKILRNEETGECACGKGCAEHLDRRAHFDTRGFIAR